MREPYAEGLATRSDPESCGDDRKGVPEALTGERVGRVLSREMKIVSGAEAVIEVEGKTVRPGLARGGGPGEVEDPRHARKHLAREPGGPVLAPEMNGVWGRGGKSKDTRCR